MTDKNMALTILIDHFDEVGWPLDVYEEKFNKRASVVSTNDSENSMIVEIERHRPILGMTYTKGLGMEAFEEYFMQYADGFKTEVQHMLTALSLPLVKINKFYAPQMKQYLMIFSVIFISACSKPIDTIIPSALEKLDTIKHQIEKLTPEQREIFDKYIMRHTLVENKPQIKPENIPADMTIGKAINIEKAFMLSEKSAIELAKSKIESYLTDPMSIQYRDLRVILNDNLNSVKGVCFEYNAKNKLGGYVGFVKEYCYIGSNNNKCLKTESDIDIDRVIKTEFKSQEAKDFYRNFNNSINNSIVVGSCAR